MKCKPDWITWLHEHKLREIEAVFSACPQRTFRRGLELGAGDGFQSTILARYVDQLVCTEINPKALAGQNSDAIEYRICSAQEAVEVYPENTFDFIFSSNLLEHVADPMAVIHGVCRLLRDDGLTVHILPSPFWKMCQMALYIPAHVLVLVERITRNPGFRNAARETVWVVREFFQGLLKGTNPTFEAAQRAEEQFGNNRGLGLKQKSYLYSLFFSLPHGISKSHGAEFAALSKRRWIKVFREAGFSSVMVRKGPVASGYGLGWEKIRKMLRWAGCTSEYIYFAHKKG